jgi:hypothetical protein
MSASGAVIDLSDDTVVAGEASKKRKIEHPRLENVWIAFHQLELSDSPQKFDKTILGIFVTRKAANRCANETWLEISGEDENENEDDDDDDDDVPDFVSEGKFKDGDGDVNTFSERVVVEMKTITHE